MRNRHLAQILGKIFRKERLMEANDSLERAGEKANLDGNNLSRIERGKQEPELKTLIKMINAYDIDLLQYKEETSKAIQMDEEEERSKRE